MPAQKPVSRRPPQKKKASFFKRHHAAVGLIIVIGWLVPPLAIFIRFGIGIDFFLNIIFTCLGYIPGHVHNYYCQWIRNNYGRGRTPKWALRAGLVEDNSAYVESTRQWGNKYGERNARNAYDDPNRPFEDEHGNVIEHEGFIEEHGIRPAQPGGGFGPNGNATHPTEDDLLAGLPDEEREQRKRAKRQHRREYGSGLDDLDQEEEAERRRIANGRSNSYGSSSRRDDDLVGDLDDPDMAAYRRSNRERAGAAGAGSYQNDNPGQGKKSRGFFGGGGKKDRDTPEDRANSTWNASSSSSNKKSGRTKKSERYGIRPDHADLGSSYSGGGGGGSRSGNGKLSKSNSTSGRDYDPRQSTDRYDIVDEDASGRRRRQSAGGEDDFLNHQF